jgi:hypothetical protein
MNGITIQQMIENASTLKQDYYGYNNGNVDSGSAG